MTDVKSTYVCLTGDLKPNNYKEKPTKNKITARTTSKLIKKVFPVQANELGLQFALIKNKFGRAEDLPASCIMLSIDTDQISELPDAKEARNDDECRQCRQRSSSRNPSTSKSKTKRFANREPGGSGSTSFSSCSVCCRSAGSMNLSTGERCLSTILKLDKEHNMFGLSNIAIVGSKVSRKINKKNEKPVFPQKTIVQVCCSRKCTRSKTDLPSSLKCPGCHSCCYEPICSLCCSVPPAPYRKPCAPKCVPDQLNSGGCYHGMKISFKQKQTFETPPIEVTPRSSCILTKPLAARSCHHVPQCVPPSSCFPYLMPCYWPARPDAPCSNPERCFHNPPCPKKKGKVRTKAVAELCPKEGCSKKKKKCPIAICPGNIPSVKDEILSRFGKDSQQFPITVSYKPRSSQYHADFAPYFVPY